MKNPKTQKQELQKCIERNYHNDTSAMEHALHWLAGYMDDYECKYNAWRKHLKEINKWRTTSGYRQWRKSILERDGHKCQICCSQENLHVHHLKPDSLKLKDGVTLCKKCHGKSHAVRKWCDFSGAFTHLMG